MAAVVDSDFLHDLTRDGYVIVRGIISPEEAHQYAEKAGDWLEGFNLGYKKDDPATWRKENLPGQRSGIHAQFSIAHAQWVWDLKTNPKWVELFERIWGTKELLVSFDGANLSIPLGSEHKASPWPHTDQSPHKPDLFCIQSLINLLPNTEKDGGLWVMRGSAPLFPDLIKAFDLQSNFTGRDFFSYKPEHIEWLEERGCRWVFPDVGPGDLIFWDSRTAHWAASPEMGRPRIAVYACYKPIKDITPEQLKLQQEAFEKGYCTTHDPITGCWKDKQEAEGNILFPYGKPVLDERQLRYAGMLPY